MPIHEIRLEGATEELAAPILSHLQCIDASLSSAEEAKGRSRSRQTRSSISEIRE